MRTQVFAFLIERQERHVLAFVLSALSPLRPKLGYPCGSFARISPHPHGRIWSPTNSKETVQLARSSGDCSPQERGTRLAAFPREQVHRLKGGWLNLPRAAPAGPHRRGSPAGSTPRTSGSRRGSRQRGPPPPISGIAAGRRHVPGGRGCRRLRSKAGEDHRLGT